MTTVRASAGVVEQAAPDSRSAGWLGYLLPPATTVTILGLVLLLLLTPLWTHFAIDLAGGSVPGGGAAAAHAISDRTVAQLVLGGDSVLTLPDGSPMFTVDEVAHLRDVRTVLYLFLALALTSATLVLGAVLRAPADARRWRAVARGGAALIVLIVVLGVVGALAFGLAFELFHLLLFPGGNWAFPADSNLIRLYPYAFWQLSAAAFGLLAAAAAALAWFVGRRKATRTGRGR